jgi:hypothetical protein
MPGRGGVSMRGVAGQLASGMPKSIGCGGLSLSTWIAILILIFILIIKIFFGG